MGKSLKMSNIGKQVEVLGDTVSKGVPAGWKKSESALMDTLGDDLQDMIQLDVFAPSTSPDGLKWAPLAPLTRAIYAKTGHGAGLGGSTLRRSFIRGQRGNLWKTGKFNFTLGSQLTAEGHLVARTFQSSYSFPKNRRAAIKMRKYISGLTGIPAPSAANSMWHPGRKIVGWKPGWTKTLKKPISKVQSSIWDKIRRKAGNAVRAVTRK